MDKSSYRNLNTEDYIFLTDIAKAKNPQQFGANLSLGIDAQLYKKYALTPDEISFIESMIKPMK